MSKLDHYAKVGEDYPLPDTMKALVLSGVGVEKLGLTTVEVPECGESQLLARVDAVMACASDNKLVDQGSDHALMYGWDVSKHPTIIGHEGAVTIVKVGEDLRRRYRIGQRFAVQPAVPTGPLHFRGRYRDNARGINKIAVGYTLPGLFAEYVLITEEVIQTGCLLPIIHKSIPYFGAALAEPFSCVISAQERMVHVLKDDLAAPRRAELGPKRNGTTLVIGAGPMGLMNVEVAMSYHPSKIIVSEVLEKRCERARRIFQDKARRRSISLICTDPDRLEDVIAKESSGKGVDDVIVALGISKVQEKALDYLAVGGVANFFGGTPFKDRIIQVDTHRVHYDSVSVVGSSGSDPSDIANVLDMMERDLIDPGNHVVKCGGLDAASLLIGAVQAREIDGKGVIYPHVRSPLFDIDRWHLQDEKEFLERALVSV